MGPKVTKPSGTSSAKTPRRGFGTGTGAKWSLSGTEPSLRRGTLFALSKFSTANPMPKNALRERDLDFTGWGYFPARRGVLFF